MKTLEHTCRHMKALCIVHGKPPTQLCSNTSSAGASLVMVGSKQLHQFHQPGHALKISPGLVARHPDSMHTSRMCFLVFFINVWLFSFIFEYLSWFWVSGYELWLSGLVFWVSGLVLWVSTLELRGCGMIHFATSFPGMNCQAVEPKNNRDIRINLARHYEERNQTMQCAGSCRQAPDANWHVWHPAAPSFRRVVRVTL